MLSVCGVCYLVVVLSVVLWCVLSVCAAAFTASLCSVIVPIFVLSPGGDDSRGSGKARHVRRNVLLLPPLLSPPLPSAPCFTPSCAAVGGGGGGGGGEKQEVQKEEQDKEEEKKKQITEGGRR